MSSRGVGTGGLISARNSQLNLKSAVGSSKPGAGASLLSAAFEGGNEKDQSEQNGALARKAKAMNGAGSLKEKTDMKNYLKDVKELVDPSREVSKHNFPNTDLI